MSTVLGLLKLYSIFEKKKPPKNNLTPVVQAGVIGRRVSERKKYHHNYT
jgi:hypothetical protein